MTNEYFYFFCQKIGFSDRFEPQIREFSFKSVRKADFLTIKNKNIHWSLGNFDFRSLEKHQKITTFSTHLKPNFFLKIILSDFIADSNYLTLFRYTGFSAF